jgi:hypothetical protein
MYMKMSFDQSEFLASFAILCALCEFHAWFVESCKGINDRKSKVEWPRFFLRISREMLVYLNVSNLCDSFTGS